MSRSALRGLTTPALLAGAVVVATLVCLGLGTTAFQRLTMLALVQLLAVIGIYLFVGLTGVFSFGQVAFMAIGAYTTAVFTVPVVLKGVLLQQMPRWLQHASLPFVVAVLAGALLAAAVAALLAVPMARMSPLSAGLATLAILVAVSVLAKNWDAVTNGSKGISAVPTDASVPLVLVVVVVVIFAVWWFQNSALGLRIRATREDDVAARAIGIPIRLVRGAAFVASAFVMGLAGGLYAGLQGNLSPDAFYLSQTFILIAMLVVGGITSLSGAVIGTLLVTAMRRVLEQVEAGVTIGSLQIPGRPGLTEVATGLALLLVLAFRPSGLLRGGEIDVWSLGRRLRRRRPPAAADRAVPDGALAREEAP